MAIPSLNIDFFEYQHEDIQVKEGMGYWNLHIICQAYAFVATPEVIRV